MVTFEDFGALTPSQSADQIRRRRSRAWPTRSSSKRRDRRRKYGISVRSRWIGVCLVATLTHAALPSSPTRAEDASPFQKLEGRWLGEGRLGMRDGVTENVKCR